MRLVYPMEKQAMRFANLLGNKFFSMTFSWLIGQRVKDTLCGTKVISRENYRKIAENRSYFGDFDPFGDFDLLFGATKQNLKIVDIPVRYQERKYGTTNIQRWKHGLLLLRMVAFAADADQVYLVHGTEHLTYQEARTRAIWILQKSSFCYPCTNTLALIATIPSGNTRSRSSANTTGAE